VVIEAGAVIGPDVVLGAGVYVGQDSQLGAATRIYPHVAIYHDVHIGEYCIVHSQAVLGADGFGFAPGSDGWEKICQLGGVRIGDRVEIGACTTVDRGTLDHTVIADGAIIDNLVQIAHNCRIGRNTAIAGCAGLAGSTIIGDNCTLSGGVGVVGHLEICDNVHVTGMSMVTKSISEPGSYSSGTPLSATRDWKRNAVRFSQLESIQKRLVGLEKKRDS
jgi:UDP-3-O-[3-hydroxymyristoyl] glucosamine N-acyltransferase